MNPEFKLIKVLEGNDPKCRVVIFQRDDGLFGIEAQQCSEESYEDWSHKYWLPIRWENSIFASPEIAEREARGRFPELTLK